MIVMIFIQKRNVLIQRQLDEQHSILEVYEEWLLCGFHFLLQLYYILSNCFSAPSKYTPSFMDLPPRETMKMDLHNKKSMPSMSPKKKLTAKFALMKSRPLSEQEILTEVTALVTKQFAMQEILSEEFRHCRIRKLS